jgi:hypothetical protein
VFFDVLGTFVIYWPRSWSVPLAALSVLMLLAVGARRLWSWRGLKCIVVAGLAVGVAGAASVALGAIVARSLASAGILPRSHVAHGQLIAAIYWLIAILLVVATVRLLLGRAFRSDVFATVWLGWSVVGLAVAWWLPGFSYVLLVPALGTAILSILPLNINHKVVLSVLLAAVILVPLANVLPVGLGPRAGLVLCPAFTLMLSPMLPFLVTGDEEAASDSVHRTESS